MAIKARAMLTLTSWLHYQTKVRRDTESLLLRQTLSLSLFCIDARRKLRRDRLSTLNIELLSNEYILPCIS